MTQPRKCSTCKYFKFEELICVWLIQCQSMVSVRNGLEKPHQKLLRWLYLENVMRPNYKQIRFKDNIVTIDCCVDCPCYIYYDKCVWDVEIQPNYAIPNECPLEEYILDEKIKRWE